MKPFDLEAAKAGKPLVTRLGEPAVFIAHVPEVVADQRVLARLGQAVRAYDERGSYISGCARTLDLFMASTLVSKWVCVYRSPVSGRMWTGDMHDSEAAARDIGRSGTYRKTLIAVVEVRWEE